MTTRRPRRSEAGTTLVEVLITVMILGVGFVAVLGGMGTSFALSAFHREQARTEPEVRRLAEAVKATPYATACPAAYTKAGIGFTAGARYTVDEPVVVDYLDESSGASAGCSTATPRLQVVRLTVTSSTDARAVETIDVVKRPG